MTSFPAINSRTLRDLRIILQAQTPLDPQALSTLSDAMDVLEQRERALHTLLCECYGVISTDVHFSECPETHPNADLAQRVLAAACGHPAEQFRKVPTAEVFPLLQAVQVYQEPAHA